MALMDESTNTPFQGMASPKVRPLTVSHVDRRTRASKRARALIEGLAEDMGGMDALSVAERTLLERIALVVVLAESHESEWLQTGKVKVESYTALLNTLRRLLVTIGLRRRAKDVTPSLSQYLRRLREEGEGNDIADADVIERDDSERDEGNE